MTVNELEILIKVHDTISDISEVIRILSGSYPNNHIEEGVIGRIQLLEHLILENSSEYNKEIVNEDFERGFDILVDKTIEPKKRAELLLSAGV